MSIASHLARLALLAVAIGTVAIEATACDDDGVLRRGRVVASRDEAVRLRTREASVAFAELAHSALARCGVVGSEDGNISRSDALAKCGASATCFAIDYYPGLDHGTAFYCDDASLVAFGTITDDARTAHYYKVAGSRCESLAEPWDAESRNGDSQACGDDSVLSERASSPLDALFVRTTDAGVAFAILPQMDLLQCGAAGTSETGVDRSAALHKCEAMPACFAVDFYPSENGGTAYYCTDSKSSSFGVMEAEGMVHMYKVRGTSCVTERADKATLCDADLVFSTYAASPEDALRSRTSAKGADFASLKGIALAQCGASAAADTSVSRGEALARCAARDDCFAVDYYPFGESAGRAFYCTDTALETFQAPRLRGAAGLEHLYKVGGASCSCSRSEMNA